MTAIEISNAISVAYEEYKSTNFDNLTPRMIADMMRAGICKTLRAINKMENELRDAYPRGGRALNSHLEICDRLRQRAEAVWSHLDREIQKQVKRAA
jgi:hypothetical protein